MEVPFVSLKPIHDALRQEIRQKLDSLMERNDFVLGAEVAEFEKAYAKHSQTLYAVGVSNGLDALKIALRTLDIGKGDEVIVPVHTYIATIFAVLEAGATPVLVEPNIDSYNIDPEKAAAHITSRTKAIMPVHLYGQPCDMTSLGDIVRKNNLSMIEDNAQAQGATFQGKVTGGFGHINATSFYPSKNLGAMGDAGAITTNLQQLYERALQWRNVGGDVKYHHDVAGYNARLDTIQAGVLNCKLPYLKGWNKERRKIAARYLDNLKECKSIVLPQTIEEAEHVYHLFVIRHEKRDALQQYLMGNEIQTQIHYPVPCHMQPALSHLGFKKGQFPITEKISESCLSLPVYVGMTEAEIDYVSEKIIAFDKQNS